MIAIVGGSGAGKTWLADRLRAGLGNAACRLSLDDFYRDRSHLAPGRRERLNFDAPTAIDWPRVERVLRDCRAGRLTRVPCYDFTRHARRSDHESWQPKPVVVMDGLWLLLRPGIRRLFDLGIFLDCPARLRLQRRIARDRVERGRSPALVRRQFRETVLPMHRRYVAPQSRWADVILTHPIREKDVRRLLEQARMPLKASSHFSGGMTAGFPAEPLTRIRTEDPDDRLVHQPTVA
jgi:uridine kinase